MKELRLKHEGRDITGFAEIIGGVLWVHVQGRTHRLDTGSAKSRRKGAAAAAASDEVRAPMPGKITKILKVAGASVKKGDALVVMEAMKMEYTLKSGTDGAVTAVECEVGAQVVLGQKLVQLKEGGD